MTRRDRILGCLLWGACGDALGAPVEFTKRPDIAFGLGGIRNFQEAYGVLGAITDDTQMTLFTVDGLIRCFVRSAAKGIGHGPSVVHRAYRRWLDTQWGEPPEKADGWLWSEAGLWQRRAPGNTCLSALQEKRALGSFARNNSKGCGTVMRSAPFGFMKLPMPEVFDLAADCAKLTHGHPSGYLAAGAFAVMIGASAVGRGLAEAVGIAREILARHAGHQETTDRLDQACQVARDSRWKDRLPELGEGWVAEEALAIAVLCALAADDPEEAVIAAVNHDGDSDSTGSIAGNLVGVVHGPGALPARWLDRLELREVIEMLGSDFADVLDERVDPEDLWDRYPGW